MGAIALGLMAALAWGLHDLAVRFVSQRASITAALATVLVSGLVFLGVVTWLLGIIAPIGPVAVWFSIGAGAAFALAGYALYRAFAIGPVRLVAPIIGSFPVLSVALAALTGTPVTGWVWLAVLSVLLGIVVVSRGDRSASMARRQAIAWSVLAAFGFFVTFALGQASAQGTETGAALLITRAVACIVVLGIAGAAGAPLWPGHAQLPLLLTMGALDAGALTAVMIAGNLPFAAYATVASSTFGIITILLAWVFLREPMRAGQWVGVGLVFAGIGYLGTV